MEGFDLASFIAQQKSFSSQAFGPGSRQVGIANHILQECDEAEAEPGDLSEWVDIMLLSLDCAWRSGLEPVDVAKEIAPVSGESIKYDLIESLKKNVNRCPGVGRFKPGPGYFNETDRSLFWIRCRAEVLKKGVHADTEAFVMMFTAACEGAKANGFSPSDIAAGLVNKLKKNKSRTWPDWRELSEDSAINHKKK